MFLIGASALVYGVVSVLGMFAVASALGASGEMSSGLAGGLLAGFGALAVAQGVVALAVGGYWIWAGVAVGRASRFARALSTVFLALTVLALLLIVVLVPVLGSGSSYSSSSSTSNGVGGVVAAIALVVLAVPGAIMVLLWCPTSTREFFARPLPCTVCEEPGVASARFCGQCGHQLPPRVPSPIVAVQVLLALNAISEVWVVVLGVGSAMLMGTIGPSVVADDVTDAGTVNTLGMVSAVLAVVAAVLIVVDLWAISGVASGRPAARLTVSVLYVLDVLVSLVALAAQGTSGPELVAALVVGGLLPAALLILLWAPPSSARHFAPRFPAATPVAAAIPAPRQHLPLERMPHSGPAPRFPPGSGRLPTGDPLTTPMRLDAHNSRPGPAGGRHATPGTRAPWSAT